MDWCGAEGPGGQAGQTERPGEEIGPGSRRPIKEKKTGITRGGGDVAEGAAISSTVKADQTDWEADKIGSGHRPAIK